ncbi:MAG TPA: SEC-C metal-binding domain-containing protein, partial [Sphingomicrobium sp.]|nr:SEC-C metal-binding domain-containing protein [Sphingomicrobium sp.]
SHGSGVNLTVYCWCDPWTKRDAKSALEHTQTVLLLNDDERRLLLELSYNTDRTLVDVAWSWVTPDGIPLKDLPRLREQADALRKRRVANEIAQRGKIVNERCPCGSGKKYKRCCMRR